MSNFADYPILPSLLATLAEQGMTKTTEIQSIGLPALLGGGSVVGVAETGSGKTLTFVLPVLHHLKSLENQGNKIENESRPRALVLVPTRELGEQVAKVFKPFTHTTRLRVRTALGGPKMEQTRRSVTGCFEVLVATTGRLQKLLELDLINLSDVRFLVIDEADQMLDEGFLAQATRIVNKCPPQCQKALFSATVSGRVQTLMNQLYKNAQVIRTKGSQKVVQTLITKNRNVIGGKRVPLLEKVLAESVTGGTLLFVNTREQCDALFEIMNERKFKCAAYRGEMDKNERRTNLKNFREGKIDYLISTDLASRGLDVEHVGRVINYHLPKGMENYLHRAGRTARAGRSGVVINFVTERDEHLINRLNEMSAAEKKKGR